MYVLYCTAVNIVNVKTMVVVNDSITVTILYVWNTSSSSPSLFTIIRKVLLTASHR